MVFGPKTNLKKKEALFHYFAVPGGKILVKTGERVAAGEVLSAGKTSVGFRDYNLSRFFGVKPQKTKEILLKGRGETVVRGEVVACKKGVLGKKEFKSPVDGVVEDISDEGILRLNLGVIEVEVKSQISGKVAEIKEGLIGISTQALIFEGIEGIGSNGRGEIMCLGERQEEVGFSYLNSQASGKIVVVGGRVNLDFWEKACALGVAGIVGGSVETDDIEEIKKDATLCLERGRRKIATPLVLAGEKDGFIKEDVFETMVKMNGHLADIIAQEKKVMIAV